MATYPKANYPTAPDAGSKPAPTVPSNTAPTVVIQQPAVGTTYGAGYYGKNPQPVNCPTCKASIVTQIEHKVGCGTVLICFGIFLVGFWCGCCLIPFCVDGAKDVKHTCPNCKAHLGTKQLL